MWYNYIVAVLFSVPQISFYGSLNLIVDISGISIELTRKNVKNLNLRILADGSVHASAPRRMPLEDIMRYLRSREGWIRSHKEKLESVGLRHDAEYITGEPFYLFGKRYTLCVREDAHFSLELAGDTAILCVPKDQSQARRAKLVESWYRQRLREHISFYLPKWEEITGLYAASWQIKKMKTRWGTCNTNSHKLWFNLWLAKVPNECVGYVILHELSHLRVANHGPRFKSLLDRHMPNWRVVKQRLDTSPLM